MPPDLFTLWPVPPQVRLAEWAARKLWELGRPGLSGLTIDSVRRVGDLLIWDAPGGRQVLAGLEAVAESQQRIEGAVEHLEAAQLGIAGSLSTVTHLSMAGLGVTALAAGCLLWRMNALDRRLDALAAELSDVRADLAAHREAHLATALDFLGTYEQHGGGRFLHSAAEHATFATNLFRGVLRRELDGRRRLVTLNQCGRYYVLALTTQVRCLVLQEGADIAGQRIAEHKPTLTALARATFDGVLGRNPEVYLDPALQAEHVTLQLLADVYQQAHAAGAAAEATAGGAGGLFEQLRPRVYGAKRWGVFGAVGRAKSSLVTKLKFLIACLEDVNRVESLRLRIELACERGDGAADLRKRFEEFPDNLDVQPGSDAAAVLVPLV